MTLRLLPSVLASVRTMTMVVMLMSFLSGCATLSLFSIDEQTLASHLQNAVMKYDHQQRANGSPVGLKLDDARVIIGPDGRDVIRLDLAGSVSIHAMMVSVPVNLRLSVEALPVYEPEEKAVYIRQLKLLDSSVDSRVFGAVHLDKVAAKQAVELLSGVLEQVPVYRLDTSDMAQRLIAASPVMLKVERGRLVFVMRQG